MRKRMIVELKLEERNFNRVYKYCAHRDKVYLKFVRSIVIIVNKIRRRIFDSVCGNLNGLQEK